MNTRVVITLIIVIVLSGIAGYLFYLYLEKKNKMKREEACFSSIFTFIGIGLASFFIVFTENYIYMFLIIIGTTLGIGIILGFFLRWKKQRKGKNKNKGYEKVLILTIILLQFLGCTSPKNKDIYSDNPYSQYIKIYDKIEIDSIIQHNNYTIIFAWTEWCKASHSQLKEYLIPFLEEKPVNVGVISICCFDYDKLADFLQENDYRRPVYLLPGSWGGLDKRRLNKQFHALFDNYKSVNYVPIVILCDSQKDILNRDTIYGQYQGVGSSILQVIDYFEYRKKTY